MVCISIILFGSFKLIEGYRAYLLQHHVWVVVRNILIDGLWCISLTTFSPRTQGILSTTVQAYFLRRIYICMYSCFVSLDLS